MEMKSDLISVNKLKCKPNATDDQAKRQMSAARDAELRVQSQKLEAVFITQMIKAMEKTIPKSNLGGTKNSMSAMMFSTVLGDAIAEQGGVGLSDMIYGSLADKDDSVEFDEINNQPTLQQIDLTKMMTLSTMKEDTDGR